MVRPTAQVDDTSPSPSPTIQKRKKTMGKRKLENTLIHNKRSRRDCFYKRNKGILKKAYELSVVSGCGIHLLIEAEDGNVYEFHRRMSPTVRADVFGPRRNGAWRPPTNRRMFYNGKKILYSGMKVSPEERAAMHDPASCGCFDCRNGLSSRLFDAISIKDGAGASAIILQYGGSLQLQKKAMSYVVEDSVMQQQQLALPAPYTYGGELQESGGSSFASPELLLKPRQEATQYCPAYDHSSATEPDSAEGLVSKESTSFFMHQDDSISENNGWMAPHDELFGLAPVDKVDENNFVCMKFEDFTLNPSLDPHDLISLLDDAHDFDVHPLDNNTPITTKTPIASSFYFYS